MIICHLTIGEHKHIPRLIKESLSIMKIGFTSIILAQGDDSYDNSGIRYIGFRSEINSRFSMFLLARRMIQKAIEIDATIYQLHDPIFFLFVHKLKRKRRIVIFDSHEFYGIQIKEKKYLNKTFRYLLSYLYKMYETYICKNIDAVIQVCTIENQDYFNNRCKRSIFLNNSYLIDEKKQKKNFCEFDKIPFSQRNCVAHVGTLSFQRGITHLIQSKAYTDARFILIGDFIPSSYKNELELYPEFNGTEITGFINQKDIEIILKNCFVGISTLLNIGQYSLIDTLPTKVYEYMMMKLPVIMSDSTYNKKINSIYEFGICVDPANPKEIGEAINYLKNNPEIAKKMGENGYNTVVNFLNWNNEEPKLLELYKSLTKNQ